MGVARVRPQRPGRSLRARVAALILLLIATGGAFAAISSAASASPLSYEQRALLLATEVKGPSTAAETITGLRKLLAELPPADAGDTDARRARVVLIGALVDAEELARAVDDPDAALAGAAALVAGGPFPDLAAWFELRSFQWRSEHGRAGVAEGMAALRRIDELPDATRNPGAEGPLALLVVDRCLAEWRWQDAVDATAVLEHGLAAAPDPDSNCLLASCRLHVYLRFGQADLARPELKRLEAMTSGSPAQPQFEFDRVQYWMATDAFPQVRRRVDELLAPGGPLTLDAAEANHLRFARGLATAATGDDAAAAQDLEAALAGELEPDERLRALDERLRLRMRAGMPAGDAATSQALAELRAAAPTELDARAALGGLDLRLALAAGDMAAARRARGELDAAFGGLLAAIAAITPRPGGIGFLHFEEMQQALADLVDAELALAPDPVAGARVALARVLAAHAHGSLARSMGVVAPTVAAVQDALGDHGALVYVPSRHGSSLLLVDGRQVVHVRLPARDELEAAAREFAGRLAGEDGDATAAAARSLAELLRVDAWLPAVRSWSVVWAVGLDLLANVPFEALPAADGALLGEVLPLTNLSSLALAAVFERRAAPAAPPRTMGLFATLAPALAAAAPAPYRLPAAELEALWRGYECAPQLEPTPDGLLRADLGRFDVVHVLAHGVLDAAREQPAGIALLAGPGDDPKWPGVLFAERAAFSVPTHGLVVLSACGTGIANRRVGEDLAGNLGGAFLRAGARGVVLSRARLRLEWTLDVAAGLDARLLAGDAPPVALQRARAAHAKVRPAARWHDAQLQLFAGSR